MTDDQNIREGIDACRPGSDDLRMPELAHVADAVKKDPKIRRLYDETQRGDAVIGRAFGEVPVPEGLQERLLTALAGSEPAPDRPAADSLSEAPVVAPASDRPEDTLVTPARAGRSRRRGWLWTVAAAGVAAAVALVTVALWPEPSKPLGIERVVNLAHDGIEKAIRQGRWRLPASAPARYPLSSAVLARARRWQRVGVAGLDRRAVVYDLSPQGGRRVTLLVCRTDVQVPGVPAAPPSSPQSTTGGRATGVWQSGGVLYILAVEGDARRYRELIKGGSGLALSRPILSPPCPTGKV